MTVIPREPSNTAVLAAVGREFHRSDPNVRVLDDHLAIELAGDRAAAVAERLRSDMSPDVLLSFARWTAVRSRFAEDTIKKAYESGARQAVILGAGLDSFAYRNTDLVRRMQTFEVDHPASQAWSDSAWPR